MGFAPAWLRQVSPPPASHDHFKHCSFQNVAPPPPQTEPARTDSFRYFDQRSDGAESLAESVGVFLRHAMERREVKVVPGRVRARVVVVRMIDVLPDVRRKAPLLSYAHCTARKIRISARMF